MLTMYMDIEYVYFQCIQIMIPQFGKQIELYSTTHS